MDNLSLATNTTETSIASSKISHPSLFDVSYSLATVYVFLVSGLAVVGTVGNIFLLYVMAKEKKMNKSVRMFICNNAIADLCVSMIAEPMCIAGKCISNRSNRVHVWSFACFTKAIGSGATKG